MRHGGFVAKFEWWNLAAVFSTHLARTLGMFCDILNRLTSPILTMLLASFFGFQENAFLTRQSSAEVQFLDIEFRKPFSRFLTVSFLKDMKQGSERKNQGWQVETVVLALAGVGFWLHTIYSHTIYSFADSHCTL